MNEAKVQKSRFGLFNTYARNALVHGRDEADRLNQTQIEPEHLLVGLIKESNGKAGSVLALIGLEAARVQAQIEEISPRREGLPVEELGLSPASKEMIELTVDEARLLNHGFIGTEHMLLAMLRQRDTIAKLILQRLGYSPKRIRSALLVSEFAPQSKHFLSGRIKKRNR